MGAAGVALSRAGASRRIPAVEPDLLGMVEGVKQANPDAMTALYALMQRGIRCLIQQRMSGREDNVQDRVHEVYLITVRAIREGKVRDPEHLAGFVRTVAVRQVCDEIRQAGMDRRRTAAVDSELTLASQDVTPEQHAIESERQERMVRTLQSLRPEQREILIRFYINGESPDHICQVMTLTPTQFRLMKSRAKQRFAVLGKRAIQQPAVEN